MAPETDRKPVNRTAHATAATPTAQFDTVQRDAETAGLPRYEAWRVTLEQRYTVMPPWYWDNAKRRATYAAHIRATLEWQRKQARINAGNSKFLGSLRGTG